MTRRKPKLFDDDENNLFDSLEDVEREFFDEDENDDAYLPPCYEDPEELATLIEEELGIPSNRRRKPKFTR